MRGRRIQAKRKDDNNRFYISLFCLARKNDLLYRFGATI